MGPVRLRGYCSFSRLEHPNIIGYVTHGVTSDGVPFLVMPWLDGMDLERRLRSGFLSIEDTLSLAHRVAGALSYLHGQGLVHRDLKPRAQPVSPLPASSRT